jgi:CheY-like chemotaxis protein
VLVLEDDNDTRELLRFVLESHGATAFLADKVMDGLQTLATAKPDVVVADIGMPDYNGYAFIAAVRREERPEIRATPVIALTAYSTPADRDTALTSGFNEYLTKPFEPEHLITTIKRLYGESRRTKTL